jgi:hypothetical protein
MDELTVVMLHWGRWVGNKKLAYNYIYNLVCMLEKYLTVQYSIVCFIDDEGMQPIAGVEYRMIPKEILTWPQNLPKLYQHSPDSGLSGRILSFDLDTIIVDNIDEFATYIPNGTMCGIKPFKPINQSKGWLPGGVMAFEAGQWEYVFNRVASNPERWGIKTKGGKERLTMKLLLQQDQKEYWQDLFPGKLVSYKRHCRRNRIERGKLGSDLPKGASVVAFHGHPRPHELKGVDKFMYSLWFDARREIEENDSNENIIDNSDKG